MGIKKVNNETVIVREKRNYVKAVSFFILFLVLYLPLFAQQQINITGIVVSEQDNSALPGISVQVKGTQTGTVTDDDGRYSIVASKGDFLIFKSIGYVEKEIMVGNKSTINISLKTSASELDQVEVIAFGKKKKNEMVGSVSSVNPSELKIPSSNLTQAFAGRIPGMIAFQRSGEPGQDNAQFFIRGVTTFGYKKDPLILVDGVEMNATDLARMNVDDIANFSILKDATATAVYGSRAANGVILIKTKEGKVGKAKLSFRFENSLSEPTKNVKLADPITYMKLNNEARKTRDPLRPLLYSDRKIENTIAGTNPLVYPANDWRKIMLKKYTWNQRAHLSVRGGGGVARYYVSGTFNNDNGLMKVDKRNNFNSNINLKTYKLRSNVDISLTKTTLFTVRLSGTFDDYKGPIDGGEGIYKKVMHSNPVLFPAYYPKDSQHVFVNHIMFGNYDEGQYTNPYADMVKGYKQYSRSLMLAQIELKQDLDFVTKGLKFHALMNTQRRSYFQVIRSYKPFWYDMESYNKFTDSYSLLNINPNKGTDYLGYKENGKDLSTSFYMESRLNYDRTFNKNGISGLIVFMAQQRLEANAGSLQQSLPARNMGISGRLTYDYDKRYFLEFNVGYNGSERFSKNHRFGFFPSLGAAWTVSNEEFFKGLKPTISNLRLRLTYGEIGNDDIGPRGDRFFYLSEVNMNDGGKKAYFGRDIGNLFQLNGVSVSRYANPNIVWEMATKENFALELGLFNKLNIEAEYFSQNRKDILMTRHSIPYSLGFSAPLRANIGAASSNGVDISLDYKQFFPQGFWIKMMGNFTYATNEYKTYSEPDYENEPWRYHVGQSINQKRGFIAEKLFIDDKEALSSPKQFANYGGGDIKYLDVNRDGKITDADKVPIGNPTVPEIVYGFGVSGGYKGFDFSMFFQGLANESFWIDPKATWPFVGDNQMLKAYADSHWSEDNQNIYAVFPRLSDEVNENDAKTSTWWMRNGDFLRVKELEIGYSLPEKILNNLYLSRCRFYINARNLFNFSHFKLWDVEMGGNGLGYPIQRVFNIGIDLSIN